MTTRVLALAVIGGLLCRAAPALAAGDGKTAAPARNPIQGTFQLDATSYSAAQGVAYPAKVFGEAGTTVFLSDRPIPVESLKSSIEGNLGSDSQFSANQPHLKITFTKDGNANFAVVRSGGTSISFGGGILSGTVTVQDGRVHGKATLVDKNPAEAKNTFDVNFDVPLLTISLPADDRETKSSKPVRAKSPKSAVPRDPVTKTEAPTNARRADSTTSSGKTPVASDFNAHSLPIPSDATNVEFKKTVNILHFQSALDCKGMVAFLQEKLAGQGWIANGTDLVAAKSAILKRAKGQAALTIFVKPNDTGSKVTVMTDGMSFDDK